MPMASSLGALKTTKHFGISANVLKLLALAAMLCDHFAEIVIRNGKLYGFSQEYYQMAIQTAEGHRWLQIYTVCKLLGRIAFPIFSFLLVEGFIHTSDFWKYFRRLLIVAILAECPYDLGMYNETYNFACQNPAFTLALALLVMYFMKRFRHHLELKWLSVLVGAAAGELLRLDYGAVGIFMIALMYNFRKEKNLRMFSGAVLSAVNSSESYFLGALAFIPLYFYNGERGVFRLKWLFYVIYPLHLAVFYVMIYVGAMITA